MIMTPRLRQKYCALALHKQSRSNSELSVAVL
jgi:hypothetical protein